MLALQPSTDKLLLNKLSSAIFAKEFNGDTGFVLYLKSEPIGVAKIKVAPDVSYIIELGIINEERGRGYGDFFTRSLLNALSFVSDKIAVSYVSGYFNKFGFKQNGTEMIIDAENLVFPKKCEE